MTNAANAKGAQLVPTNESINFLCRRSRPMGVHQAAGYQQVAPVMAAPFGRRLKAERNDSGRLSDA